MRAGAMLFLRLAGQQAASGRPSVLDGGEAVTPETCAPAWRAALSARTTADGPRDADFEPTVRLWLDAALHHPRLRDRITRSFVDAAEPLDLPYGLPEVFLTPGQPPAAELMIALVRRWSALDPRDPVRRMIREDVTIPLTRPWPLRLARVLYVRMRTPARE
jgi:hypothetical protein